MKRNLFLLAGTLLVVPCSIAGALPICESANSDTDGDGYGWEREQSCIVDHAALGQCEDRGDFPWGWNPVTLTSCLLGVQTEPTECVDTDGDGFGWNGISTCIVSHSQCEDRGGYPWGWNPVSQSSCRLDEQNSQPDTPQAPAGCTDTDGDGSAALTSLLNSDIGGGLASIDGIVYFVGTTAATGSELSAYNPSTGEVNVIGDVFTGPVSSLPGNLTVLNGKLYFTARDLGVPQRDIYVYDPATSEEPLPSNLFPDDFIEGDTIPRNLIAFDDKIFFTADELGVGNELMVYDPETGVFTVASDINTGPDSSDPGTFIEVLGKLYFSADDGINGRELWAYDPLTETSTMVTDLSTSANGSDPGKLFVIDDKIYYNTRSGGQTRVYDPQTGERPALLEYTVNGETTNGIITGSANGRLILEFDDATRGAEPWLYNPETNTTRLIADTNPGTEGSRSNNFVALNDEIYFSAEANFGNFEIWIYDEASEQTRRFNEVTGTDLEFPADLIVLDNRLYFVAGPLSGPRDRRQRVYDPSCD